MLPGMVELRGRSGQVRQQDSVQLGRQGGRMAKSGLLGAVRMARRPDGEEAAWSGLFGWQVGRVAKQRHGLGRAGREWSCALMTVRSAGQGKGATHERGAGGLFRLAKGRVADCAEMKRAMGREAHGSFLWKTEVFLEG